MYSLQTRCSYSLSILKTFKDQVNIYFSLYFNQLKCDLTLYELNSYTDFKAFIRHCLPYMQMTSLKITLDRLIHELYSKHFTAHTLVHTHIQSLNGCTTRMLVECLSEAPIQPPEPDCNIQQENNENSRWTKRDGDSVEQKQEYSSALGKANYSW